MRNRQIFVIFALVAVLIGYGAFEVVDWSERDEAKRIEKQREKKRLEQKDDTIRILIKQMREQDLAYLKALQSEKIRADRAEEQLQKSNDKLKSIRFVGFGNDTTGRARAIKDLYPSY